MNFQNDPEVQIQNISRAFSNLFDQENTLKILAKDGNVSVVSRDLMIFTSPLIKNIIKDVPCYTNSVIVIPDVCKDSVDHLINIIGSGITNISSMSVKKIQKIRETAKILQIELTDLTMMVADKKSVKENYSGENFRNIDIKTELPDPEYFEPHDEHETHKLPSILSAKDIDVKEELKTEDFDFEDETETPGVSCPPHKKMVVGVKEEPLFKSYPPDLLRIRTEQIKSKTLEQRQIKCESSKTNDQMQNHKASKKERKVIRMEMRRKKKMKQLAKTKAKEALAAESKNVNKTSKVNATARKGLADVIRTKKSENKVESEKVPGNKHDLDIRQKYDYKLYV
eukprot:GFUD01095003.1.p1 GENE.GFUD01095003.1~~GFUD01095003.1.p1  ORF type:complete len:340 (+),score=91.37 GFUD01095003.1:54-1073(+)